MELATEAGSVIVGKSILAEGVGVDGDGGRVLITTSGTVSLAQGTTISAATSASNGLGGQIAIASGTDSVLHGVLTASGSGEGGQIDIISGRDVLLDGTVQAKGVGAGSFGGVVAVVAGAQMFGGATVSGEIDVGGGICGTTTACGLAGALSIYGCNVSLAADASVQLRAAEGGAAEISALGQLTIATGAVVNATSNIGSAGVDGLLELGHSQAIVPNISSGSTLVPPALVIALPDLPCTP